MSDGLGGLREAADGGVVVGESGGVNGQVGPGGRDQESCDGGPGEGCLRTGREFFPESFEAGGGENGGEVEGGSIESGAVMSGRAGEHHDQRQHESGDQPESLECCWCGVV